jgi:hypothetical protein
MRSVLGIVLIVFGLMAMAQEQILAEGTDKGPKVEVKIPEKDNPPLIQTYRTVNGDLAAVVSPEPDNQYVFIQTQEAYQTQYPQDREADVPINESNWIFLGW